MMEGREEEIESKVEYIVQYLLKSGANNILSAKGSKKGFSITSIL